MSLMNLPATRNVSCPLPGLSAEMEQISFRNMVEGVFILLQTLLGALGNFSLLCHYLSLYHREGRVRTTDFILLHLTISNTLVIVSKGVPQTMVALGIKLLFSDLVCELLLYVQRVGRCMSICTTSTLGVFQAITISPKDSCWENLKVKAPHYVTSSVSLCWILYIIVNLIFPMHILYISKKWSKRNVTVKRYFAYCYTTWHENVSGPLYSVLIVFPEISFSVLIVLAGGSMIFNLYQHKQRVQHLHRNNVSSRPSAESRATHRILLLVSSFLCFHTLSSFFNMFLALLIEETGWLQTLGSIITLCFPSLSPFLVMRQNPTACRLSFGTMMHRKSHGLSLK